MTCSALLFQLVLAAAGPEWKEFSLAAARERSPATGRPEIRNGVLRARSITPKTLLALATELAPSRIVGPAWMDTERYSVDAVLAPGRDGLRSRSAAGRGDEFRALLLREIGAQFRLEYRRERTRRAGYMLNAVSGGEQKFHKSKVAESSGFRRTGTKIINIYSTVVARGVTWADLCAWLERQLSAPVLPDTNLPAGTWDVRLRWRSGDQRSLLAAMEEQLGLMLSPRDVVVEQLIVGRSERP